MGEYGLKRATLVFTNYMDSDLSVF